MRISPLFFTYLLFAATTHLLSMDQTDTTITFATELSEDLLYYGALGNSEIVCNLLNNGADPNTCDDNNMTLMHYAAQYGFVDIVDRLLKHPALIITDIATGEKSPFYLAIKYQHMPIIECILKVHIPNCDELLCSAAKEGSLNMVRTLLACGIDANALDSKEESPLYHATDNNHVAVMQLLIANGATLDYQPEKDGITALHEAARKGYTYAARLLVSHSNKNTINAKSYTSCNDTPLYDAAIFDHINVVRELLKHPGIEVNALSNGETPLDVTKNDDIKSLLIEHGGKENQSKTNSCVVQ